MLRVYDSLHNAIAPLTDYEGLCVSEEINGETQIEFSMPKTELNRIKEEYYIRTPENEFIIKEISVDSDDLVKVVAKINVEELKGTPVKYFETVEKTVESCLQLALSYCPGGWTIESDITKKRTLRQSQKSVWDIIQSALDLYIAEMTVDAIAKKITIKSKIGEDKGSYLMEGLNLRNLSISSDTYDLVTRIYPVGADGLTIADVNDGCLYVENHEYSNKILAMYWEDNRYTIAENLRDDAIEKLDTLARPTRSYNASVIDLATAAGLNVFDYHIGDTVWLKSELTNEKHRIVSIKRYPDEPEKNTCVLSTNLSSLVSYMEDNLSATQAVELVVTQDGRIDKSKVDLDGAGVPAGGTKGQVLAKYSDEDGDVIWKTVSSVSGAGITIEELEAMIKIKSEDIQDGAITHAKIGEAAITEANIADAAISRAKIQQAAIGTAQIDDAAITSAKIGAAEIDGAHLKVGIIDTAHIKDGSINSAKIENAAITTAKIGAAQITEALIADAAVTTAKIHDLAVDTAKIKDGAILNAKIGDAEVDSAKITDAAIDDAKIKNGSITNAKIADATITSAKILTLDAGLIKSGTIQTERLLITGQTESGMKSIVLTINELNGTPQLSSTTIDGGSITDRTITAENIMTGSITANEIEANTITGDKIAAGAITADHIGAGTITADKIAGGTITLGQLNQSAIDSILGDSKSYTDQKTAYYGQFLNFNSEDGLTIGSGETAFKTVIDSEKISFSQGSQELAYINKDKMYITDGEITNSLTLGHYVFVPRVSGNLSIVWRD